MVHDLNFETVFNYFIGPSLTSVARLGDLLDYGQLFKAFGSYHWPKSSTFLGIFCKDVKIYHFSNEIIFGQLLYTFGDFFLVTLVEMKEMN